MATTDLSTTKLNGQAKQAYGEIKHAAGNIKENVKDAAEPMAEQFSDMASDVVERVQKGYSAAESYAKKNPLYVALGAAGLGLAIGAFLARRK